MCSFHLRVCSSKSPWVEFGVFFLAMKSENLITSYPNKKVFLQFTSSHDRAGFTALSCVDLLLFFEIRDTNLSFCTFLIFLGGPRI